ncbi:hypothetical protein OHS33_35840 [Streptomyces sp. NBC_00536]|uniref:hypothetical protein n=1 Tax=Streptomyces sp. NBC_00536 TaxID=2975769 RepID=UPI002E80D92F|nr:hypothetical protein [Streptomyces sp. NBC_00536]WUC83279.1 hypothetical protein OHS33_35840 [Streptomyces sp. NBC_00536]
MTATAGGRLGIAVLTPDLFITGAWPALAERLADRGLHVCAFTVVNATNATMAALYEGNVLKAGRARIASTLGRSLPLLDMNVAVAVAGPPGQDVPAILDEAKGPSPHGTRQPDALREAGSISHRCMSLLHTADPALAGRDAALLFGPDVMGRLHPGDRLDPHAIGDLRGMRCPGEEPHPYDIVCRTIVRITTVLSLDALLAVPGSEDLMATVRRGAKALAVRLNDVKPPDLPDAVRSGLRPLAALVHSAPPTIAAPLTEAGVVGAELVRALGVLLDPALWSERSGELVATALARSGLFVSPWERHMILVALTFLPRACA